MAVADWAIVGVAVWVLWTLFANWVLTTAPFPGNPILGLGFRVMSHYLRLVHRVRVEGAGNLPRFPADRPMIVVANHTAGVDPLLIQLASPFFIRWMMALDMRLPALEWAWQLLDIISVDRQGRDVNSARTARKHLEGGGVIGIFPEGALERPPRTILPFAPGVGLLIRRSDAIVVPYIVTGTPQVDPAWGSLWRTSHSVVRIMPPIDYADSDMSAAEIAGDLRTRFAEWTGWPLNDTPPAEFPGGKGKRGAVEPAVA